MDLLAELRRIFATMPPHPVAPENRRLARLCPSAYLPRGQVYRLVSPLTSPYPLIVMNDEDVRVLRAALATVPWIDVDQEIADCAEQVFALQEARGAQ